MSIWYSAKNPRTMPSNHQWVFVVEDDGEGNFDEESAPDGAVYLEDHGGFFPDSEMGKVYMGRPPDPQTKIDALAWREWIENPVLEYVVGLERQA